MTPATGACVLVIDAVSCAAAPALCERLRVLLSDSDAEVVLCDVGALPADAVTVDALARLQLSARRLGRQIRLDGTTRELDRLIAFAGLADVLRRAEGLGVQPVRQAEEREQTGRVQERVDRDDASV